MFNDPKAKPVGHRTMFEIKKLHHRFCNYCEAFKGNTPRSIHWYRGGMRRLFA